MGTIVAPSRYSCRSLPQMPVKAGLICAAMSPRTPLLCVQTRNYLHRSRPARRLRYLIQADFLLSVETYSPHSCGRKGLMLLILSERTDIGSLEYIRFSLEISMVNGQRQIHLSWSIILCRVASFRATMAARRFHLLASDISSSMELSPHRRGTYQSSPRGTN